MIVTAKYGENELKDILMADHLDRIGNPPDGTHWVILFEKDWWQGYTITSVRTEPTEPEVEVANG
jgi:hypothetical protein